MSPRTSSKAAASQTRRRKVPRYLLRLYVTGTTARSIRAIQNARRICDEHLHGQYKLEIVDLHKELSLARKDQILAAPTLIKRLPLPLRHLIGDLSDDAKVLAGLQLTPKLR